ncbi:PREDICTED: F-box/kelch-repeat protein At3g04660-like [Camelina sativa]|uniref:F-box/kelch-repeat protein At3g04660-like n=1 Tax=Camelina sativa TaxID=90675 RepID=A0ABM0VI32_CAMSA|nr:PREDICTED: F-box/kelch-repeat protein At3g04660-like [Camelina sativa]
MKRVKKENVPQIRLRLRGDHVVGLSVDLPADLITEILLKLPSKSLAKFIVLSKHWSSEIRSKRFLDLYMKQSLTRPCILFTFHHDSIRFFHLASQSCQDDASFYTCKSSFPLSLDRRVYQRTYDITPPVRGLICVQDLDKVLVSNPVTGQFLVLPKVRARRRGISRYFGYDPVKDEYKVLCMTVLKLPGTVVSGDHQVFTLGREAQKKPNWRKIKCNLPHCPATNGLCSDGVVYYGAWSNSDREVSLIVGFNVGSEEFTLVKLPDGVEIDRSDSGLVNYKRKVALVSHSHLGTFDMWILEDVVKPEWLKISVVVPSWQNLVRRREKFSCRGVISTGEFIFQPFNLDGPLCVIIYDREEDSARRVETEGLGVNLRAMSLFLYHAESYISLKEDYSFD